MPITEITPSKIVTNTNSTKVNPDEDETSLIFMLTPRSYQQPEVVTAITGAGIGVAAPLLAA